MKRLFVISLILCLMLGVFLSPCSGVEKGNLEVLKVGVLLDTEGENIAAGKASVIAVKMAAEDINSYLKEMGHNKEIRLYIEDTKADPQIAAEKIKNLKDEGIIPVLCDTSEAILALIPYAKKNNQLLLSGMSTAPHLSEKNNNLFRFCLNDEKQALALVHLAKEMNINSVVLVYRNDIYGNNLKSLVLKYGEKLDMDIDQEVQYDTNETNYANIVSSIEEKVRIEKSENPPDKVAVLLISFNEAHDIFKAAEGNAELESTRWIGCDGIEANAAVFKEKNTLNFARNTGLIICNFGADMNEYYRDIPEKLKQKTGLDKVPVTALFYYDIMLVLTRSWLTVAKPDFDMFSKSIPVVSNTSTFVTDDMGMNEHGDRKWGVYDFWQIKNETFGKIASIGYGDWAPEGGFEWYLSK